MRKRKVKNKNNDQPSRKVKLIILGAIVFGLVVHEVKCALVSIKP